MFFSIFFIFFSVITCGTPSSIENGHYSGSDFNFGGVINYSCDEKYELIQGDSRHECVRHSWWSSGYWEGDVPYCACE